jgi:transposase
MDITGWHKSRGLKIPQNITIIYLPPYCPELNPVERLWLYMKQNTIKNHICATIEELENAVCTFIKNFQKNTIKQICNFNYIV